VVILDHTNGRKKKWPCTYNRKGKSLQVCYCSEAPEEKAAMGVASAKVFIGSGEVARGISGVEHPFFTFTRGRPVWEENVLKKRNYRAYQRERGSSRGSRKESFVTSKNKRKSGLFGQGKGKGGAAHDSGRRFATQESVSLFLYSMRDRGEKAEHSREGRNLQDRAAKRGGEENIRLL